jgi:hypothetical protein
MWFRSYNCSKLGLSYGCSLSYIDQNLYLVNFDLVNFGNHDVMFINDL